MPYINIRLGSELNDQQRNALYQRTTELMQSVMKKNAVVTLVQIDESKAQQWSVNGTPLTQASAAAAYVDIKVTEGTNSEVEKQQMIAETMLMLKEVVGTMQQACYVVIDDISASSWGYDGLTQAYRASN